MARIRPTAALVVSLVLMAAACTGGGSDTPARRPLRRPRAQPPTSPRRSSPTTSPSTVPKRVQVGIFSSTQDAGVQVVSFGDISVDFAYRGADGSAAPQPGPSTTFSYLPAPTTAADGQGPALTNPSDARGVYQGEDIRFDQVGVWTATIEADIDTVGPVTLESNFAVPRSTRASRSRAEGAEDREPHPGLQRGEAGLDRLASPGRRADPRSRTPRMDDRGRDRPGAPGARPVRHAGVLHESASVGRRSRPWSNSPPTTPTRPCSSTSRSGATTTRAS